MEFNPGEELRQYLEKIYPSPSDSMNMYINEVDHDFMEEGELADLVYTSLINYIVRRLIAISSGIYEKYPIGLYGEYRYQNEISKYLRDFTRYPDKYIDRIKIILVKCLQAINSKKPTSREIDRFRKYHQQRKSFCYICGEEIDYQKGSTTPNAFTVDHIWPRSMGGVSSEYNYGQACKTCNSQFKKDFIDTSDFHYEEIAFPGNIIKLNNQFKVAVFSKTNFCCSVCGQPATIVGKLSIGRIEPSDGWHFMNLTPYCMKDLPMEDRNDTT